MNRYQSMIPKSRFSETILLQQLGWSGPSIRRKVIPL